MKSSPRRLWTVVALVPLSLIWLAASSSADEPGASRSEVDPEIGILTEPLLFPVSPAPPAQSATLRRVLTGLSNPTSVTHTPLPGDNRLFITQQNGLARILENGRLREEPFLDLRGETDHSGGDEKGLLSLAFHPRYAQNGLFFAAYTNLQGAITVARFQVSADPNRADPASRRILLTIPKPFGNHNGGQLQFGPDGHLYIGTGDGGGGGDPDCRAQQGTSLLGKILRIDVDANAGTAPYYGIPASNPFRGGHPMPDEVWAYGLRNPWRFSFDRRTGDLWISDVGQGTREEVNLQPAGSPGGQNYGWKVMEGSSCFSRSACPAATPACGSPELTMPVLEYEQGHGSECSVTGGYVYRGTALPHLWGHYVFGDLCSGRIWTAVRRGGTWQVRELAGRAQLLTSFGEDRNGELYLTTLGGDLFRIVARHPVDTPGLYDASTARFLLEDLFTGGPADRTVQFGPSGARWLPVAGDWNGDGRTGIGLWAPASGTFRLRNALTRGPAQVVQTLPVPSPRALPLAGDWNGDGRDTVGLYDPTTSTFHLTNSLTSSRFEIVFRFGGAAGLLPVVGDWNGDGRDSVGVYDPATGVFRLRNPLSAGPANETIRFGPAGRGWLPLAGDWNGDGRDSLGLYDPATSIFRLRNALRQGAADAQVRFGTPGAGWVPLVGEW